jgi:acyl carrier protein
MLNAENCPCTLHPAPCTLHPAPCTLHPLIKGLEMTREKLITLVNQIFVEQFELEPEELTPEKRIFEDFALDSLDIVDLITGLQRQFGVPLRDNKDVLQIRTLQDVYDLCEKLVEENPAIVAKLSD